MKYSKELRKTYKKYVASVKKAVAKSKKMSKRYTQRLTLTAAKPLTMGQFYRQKKAAEAVGGKYTVKEATRQTITKARAKRTLYYRLTHPDISQGKGDKSSAAAYLINAKEFFEMSVAEIKDTYGEQISQYFRELLSKGYSAKEASDQISYYYFGSE